MSKKPVAKEAAPAKTNVKKINRSKRNAMERKCLPKSMKILFAGSDRAFFRTLESMWKESKKRTAVLT